MPREPISVRIDKDVHQQVKSAAPARGTNIEGAYDEALRNWLEQKANIPGEVLAKDIEAMAYYSESVTRAVNQVAHCTQLFVKAIGELEKAVSDAKGQRALDEFQQSIPVIENATSPIQRATERLVRAREAVEADRRDTADPAHRLADDRTTDSVKKSGHRRPARGAA